MKLLTLRLPTFVGAVLCLTFGLLQPDRAAAVIPSDLVIATLVPKTTSVQPGGVLLVDLHFKIKQGWHTYWRNPGDSGLPTRVSWNLPPGVSAGDPQWPAPEQFSQAGIGNYGYAGEADLLIPISVAGSIVPGSPLSVRGHASWLVCSDICVPGGADLALKIPIDTKIPIGDPDKSALFDKVEASLPKPAKFDVTFAATKDHWQFHVPAAALEGVSRAKGRFYPYDGATIDQAAAETSLSTADGLSIAVARSFDAKQPGILDGVLTIEDEGKAATRQAYVISANPASAGSNDTSAGAADVPAWRALLLAFVGGIILNAMPCVFPVLSLKVLALLGHAGSTAKQRVRDGASYSAGILVSFAALGGALLVLRGAGHQLGWGFQLQSPAFVAILAYLLLAMGLGLSGVFEVNLSALADSGVTGGGRGGWSRRGGFVGAFSSGILATIVATPCTGPFMGVALGSALVAPAPVAMGIFLALGAGLAFPFMMLACIPSLHQILPRPGLWMVTLRQLLAFPLYATAAWLLWVLVQQVSPDTSLAAFAGLVLVGFAAWVYGTTRVDKSSTRRIGAALALGSVAAALFATTLLASAAPALNADQQTTQGVRYEAFSPTRLASLQQQGVPVFINLTAAWCLTCQVNERVVLDRAVTGASFTAHKVVAMKGDWSRQDPVITQFLQSHGRSGVPLYMLYNGHGKSTLLPQILTESGLAKALSQLGS